ncbi:MAG TPA: LemA family protein [Candidatus Pacearchaeota archaeon]|nr:LemA family protein [Candidatus Pacearchaeota archaeon]HPR79654.1 LemA family protein [Candidatus Pacearchaeota archaeon]
MQTLYVLLIIIILFFLFILGNFLFLIRVKKQTVKAFKEVDNYLKRKIELANQVLSEISKYVSYEKDFVKNISEAKRRAEEATTVKEKKEAGSVLSIVLRAAFAASEKYPELKVSQKLKQLKGEIDEIEEGVDSLKSLFQELIEAVKKLLKTKPFGVIYDLFKKETKIVNEKVKKVKKRIIKNKKK